jgi:hypothetical protein
MTTTTTAQNSLFQTLPSVLEEYLLSFRLDQVLFNKTTGEYTEYSKDKLQKLLKKNTQKMAVISHTRNQKNTFRIIPIGESCWKKNHHIIIVPLHLENYVKNNYHHIDY